MRKRGLPDARWEARAPLPVPTQEVYATTLGSEILVAGGLRSPAGSDRSFETVRRSARYSPAEDAWSAGPDLPAPRHHLVLAAVGGTAYGFGGFVGSGLEDGFRYRSDVYALAGGAWRRVGAMPEPLGETVALALNGRVHVVTGSLHPEAGENRGATGLHLVYDPEANAWDRARPAPTPRSSATGAVIDGRLYVAGGRTFDGGADNKGALERYDPEADRWDELRPLPQPSGGLAGAALGGRLYCFGGEYFGASSGVYADAAVYDPDADAWTGLPDMTTPRHGLAAAASGGAVYAIGGNTAAGVGAATATTVEALVP